MIDARLMGGLGDPDIYIYICYYGSYITIQLGAIDLHLDHMIVTISYIIIFIGAMVTINYTYTYYDNYITISTYTTRWWFGT